MAEDYKLIDNEEKHRYEFQIDVSPHYRLIYNLLP